MNIDALTTNAEQGLQNEVAIKVLKKSQDIVSSQAAQLIQSLESAAPKNGRVDGYA
jgi:hypothetical protein